MNVRAVPQVAVDFVAQHEGCELTAYRDSGGVLTIGYGSTENVTAGMVITQDEAKQRLASDLATAGSRLQAQIGAVVFDLTENQYAALLSFDFNVGANPSWTIWKRLRARQFDQIPAQLMLFVNVHGQKVQGLVNRRADEVKLWSTDEPGSVPADPPSSVTRDAPTPPTAIDPVPVHTSATILTLATGAVAGVPAAAGQVIQAVTPYADHSAIVEKMIGTLSLVAAIAVVIGLVLAWVMKRRNQQ